MFPLMCEDELNRLAADIKENGLIDPIVLSTDGATIIDGRNRWRACDRAIVDPVFKRLGQHYSEPEIIRYIIAKNIERRHLNSGQIGIIVVQMKPLIETLTNAAKERMVAGQKNGGKKAGRGRNSSMPISAESNPPVRDQLANTFGIGHGTVAQAKKVVEHSPSLAAKVTAGDMTLNEATG